MAESDILAHLDHLSAKVQRFDDRLGEFDRTIIRFITETETRDRERADERASLLTLPPRVSDLERLAREITEERRGRASSTAGPEVASVPADKPHVMIQIMDHSRFPWVLFAFVFSVALAVGAATWADAVNLIPWSGEVAPVASPSPHGIQPAP